MRGIGEVARASGLSVSALRFYDSTGVLVPAAVDPSTGYRRYSDDQIRAARMIAELRRVSMPVAEIAKAVQTRHQPGSVRRQLEAHQRRLETGLADATRALLRVHALLDLEENLMTQISVIAADLATALDGVRFAASTDPAVPMLGGVLFETSSELLTLVATDRHRMAIASTRAVVDGPPIRLVLPLTFVDELRPLLTGSVSLELTAAGVCVQTPAGSIDGVALDVDFPDRHRIIGRLGDSPKRVTVDTARLHELLMTTRPAATRELGGVAYPISVLKFDSTEQIRLAESDEWESDQKYQVAVNREFLLQALEAGGTDQLVLELDGPINPLAVRVPGDDSRFSILMPVRN